MKDQIDANSQDSSGWFGLARMMRLCCAVALVLKTLSLQGFESEDFNDNITVTLAGAGPTGPSGLHLSVQEIPSAHPKELITLRTHLASSVNAGDTGLFKDKKDTPQNHPSSDHVFFFPENDCEGFVWEKHCHHCHQRLSRKTAQLRLSPKTA